MSKPSVDSPSSPTAAQFAMTRNRTSTMSSTVSSVRSAAGSVSQLARDALNVNPPLGAWAAAAEATSRAPTLGEIRRGSFAEEGWRGEVQREMRRGSSGDSAGKRRSVVRRVSSGNGAPAIVPVRESGEFNKNHAGLEPFPPLAEEPSNLSNAVTPAPIAEKRELAEVKTDMITTSAEDSISPTESTTRSEKPQPHMIAQDHARRFSSGYIPPPKLPWTTSTMIGLAAFWKWFLTPLGFLITIYCLNVVAWGGMLFLLLCGAAPEMCWVNEAPRGWFRDCNHLQSPRRIWLEIDSQILNGLFCVTGFGLIPWRFRDLYYLLRWRLCSEKKYGTEQKLYGLRTLAGINQNWLRLPGSDTLDEMSEEEYTALTHPNASAPFAEDPRVPHPLKTTPHPPLTGIRAPPTKLWKLDFFIWCNVWNTFLQGCLCGFMWGFDRYKRPSWSTGLFIALASIVAGIGGFVTFLEGKVVKKVEGVQPSEAVLREIEKKEIKAIAREMGHEHGEGGEKGV
nr:hypothetical protein B0A51_17370 [Rachicladosporium sp. CCFEE 5018]